MRRHLLRWGGRLIALCAVILLMAGPAYGLPYGNGGWQWQNPLPRGGNYTDGYFVDAAHGWLISGGTIYRTADGGVTLAAQLRANVAFRAITFVGREHGWAVGYPATASGTAIVYRTVNAGRSWSRVRLKWREGLTHVSFATTRIGWATSRHAVLHTTDGGVHWTRHFFATNLWLGDVQALGARQAWIAEGDGALLRTVDGGATWRRFGAGDAKHVSVVWFTSAQNGWAGGGDGKLVHTTDGGLHWKLQLAGQAIFALSFSDASNGWVSTTHTVYHTTDAGAHWLPVANAPATWVFALTPLGATIGARVGGAPPAPVNGFSGGLSHTSDGGATWQPATSAADDYFGTLNGLQFVDDATGWAVGAGGEILATTNGGGAGVDHHAEPERRALHRRVDRLGRRRSGHRGAHHRRRRPLDGADLGCRRRSHRRDVHAQSGWATGVTSYPGSDSVTGVIIHTADGGQLWTTQATPVSDAGLGGVAFADSLHGLAVGEVQGDSSDNVTVILGTDDGGTTWTEQHSYNPPEVQNTGDGVLNGVACTDADHAVAVGGGSGATEIFRTVDGGATWTRLVKPAAWSVYLSDVDFVDADHGWAVGQGPAPVGAGTVITAGTIIATTDGGAIWTKLLVPGNLGAEALGAISFASPTEGWMAGGGADILTTTTAGHTP